jgi:hypothetical protein
MVKAKPDIYWLQPLSYLAVYEPTDPTMLVPFPSTVLFPRDWKTAGALPPKKPMPLSVTIELETLTVATPVEELLD